MELFFKVFGVAVVAVGVILIYDSRRITRKFFSSSRENSTVKVLKIVGFILAISGTLLAIFC